ncbi:hypothetical protein D7S81_34580, partial [Ralstonia insidiosa]|nr:hypothetical protein [Ralstonia insidiosa]
MARFSGSNWKKSRRVAI